MVSCAVYGVCVWSRKMYCLAWGILQISQGGSAPWFGFATLEVFFGTPSSSPKKSIDTKQTFISNYDILKLMWTYYKMPQKCSICEKFSSTLNDMTYANIWYCYLN